MNEYKRELNVVINIAKKAGSLVKKLSENRHNLTIENKLVNDFVTNADNASEKLIIEELLNNFPEYDILAEESGEKAEGNRPKWIIDPIDGTLNYMKGIPIYGISIGLEVDNEIVMGVVFNVPMNEMYYAVKGQGSYLNNEKINVSKTDDFDRILIGTGFPFRRDSNFDSYMKLFKQFAMKTSGLRRPGAASVDLCWTACGNYDAFFEFSLHPWDVSAGSIIIKEAGGIVTDPKGSNDYIYGSGIVGANNKKVHDFILEHIDKYYYG